jgi:hypothetical protein
MLPLLEAFLCQLDIVVRRTPCLLDESVKQYHLIPLNAEQRSRNLVAK